MKNYRVTISMFSTLLEVNVHDFGH